MNRDSKVRKNPNVVARKLAEREGGVLLHLESGAYHGTNPVGLAVWELMDGDRTVAEIINGVRDRVDGAPPQLEHDVVAFLESVLERDLILVVE